MKITGKVPLCNGKVSLVTRSSATMLKGSTLGKEHSQSYVEQAQEKRHSKCLQPAHVQPVELTASVTDRAGQRHGTDVTSCLGEEMSTLYRLPAGLLRVINEVRANKEDR